MRNLLEEFRNAHGNHGIRNPTILGVREHVFTGRLLFNYLTHLPAIYIYLLNVSVLTCSISFLIVSLP